MSAATQSIATPRRQGTTRNFPLKAAALIYQGTFLAITTGGLGRPAVALNITDKVVGIASEEQNNTLGLDSALSINAELGIFEVPFTGTAPTQADVAAKAPLYVSDDNTVTLSAVGTPPRVGTLFALSSDSAKCWVKID